MGFILDGLDTEDYDRQYNDRELLARIIGYFKPYTREMLFVAVTITLNSLAGTGSPILIARGIDLLATNSTTEAMLLLAGGGKLFGVAESVVKFIHQ